MKELSIEEKAKAYDEAIKVARFKIKNDKNHVLYEEDITDIFPELKEKTDKEMIQKLISIVHLYYGEGVDEERDACLKWLDKQKIKPYTGTSFKYNNHTWGMCARDNGVEILFDGELKAFLSLEKSFIYPIHPQPTIVPKSELETNKEKVEPKFKVGEWVVSPNGVYWHIDAIRDGRYQVSSNLGTINDWSLEANIYHRFTIQDAKDGDVLTWDNSKCIVLFKNIYDKESFNSYGFVGHCTNTFVSRLSYHDIKGVHPAAKEQRDLLFEKMEEAGYMWDSKNKELQEIPKFKVGDWVIGSATTGNEPRQIAEVLKEGYKTTYGRRIGFSFEKDMHLWTIQDAKDGDVLATSSGAFIYNGNNGGGSCPGSYCGINTLGNFQHGAETHWTSKKVNPATKEQRDILFKKMKEKGYEWDSEKKEMKKI